MKVTVAKQENNEPKVAGVAGDKTKTNMAPVTHKGCVNVRQTPANISEEVIQYGNIGKASFLASFTAELKKEFDVPEVVEMSKADAETILNLIRKVTNDGLKTAHVSLHEDKLSSVTMWTPTSAALKVMKKASRSTRNPAFLAKLTALKEELATQGVEDFSTHADYIALEAEWIASETSNDATGQSVVKIKEFTIQADGSTPADATTARGNSIAAK